MEEVKIQERLETEIKELIPIEDAVAMFKKFRRPPDDALKPIDAGRLKGKTEINPVWRQEALTDLFGAYGDGWKYEIVERWKEPIEVTKEIIVHVFINLYTRNRRTGEWNAPSPATGSAYLIVKDKNGLHGNENAWASAITDAFGKACKVYGIGYDVYLGKTNRNTPPNYNNNYNNKNNNYNRQQPPTERPVQVQNQPQEAKNPPKTTSIPTNQSQPATQSKITQEELQQNEMMKMNAMAKIKHTVKEINIPYADVTKIIQKLFNKNKTNELSTPEMIALSNNLESNWKKMQQEKAAAGNQTNN